MNAATQPATTIAFPTPPLRPADLTAVAHAGLSWLWHGYLAPRKVTALTEAKEDMEAFHRKP
jgi:hypothetical protein